MKKLVGGASIAAVLGVSLLVAETAPAAPPGQGAPSAVSQVAASLGAKVAPVAATTGACAAGMVEVEGDYCPYVEHICTKWIGDDGAKRDRCAEYRPTGRCIGAPVHKRFCIDKYEYPNQAGVKPAVAVMWDEARDQCAAIGKRLCASQEWTVACEGPEHRPYPNGFTRDAEACNIDRQYIQPNNEKYGNLATRAEEIARVDQRDASGARPGCVSSYGVHDMIGNVDEWVVNEKGKIDKEPYKSGLKGGYWGPVRNRCRPMTTDHNEWHSGYQIGFRCCADAK